MKPPFYCDLPETGGPHCNHLRMDQCKYCAVLEATQKLISEARMLHMLSENDECKCEVCQS